MTGTQNTEHNYLLLTHCFDLLHHLYISTVHTRCHFMNVAPQPTTIHVAMWNLLLLVITRIKQGVEQGVKNGSTILFYTSKQLEETLAIPFRSNLIIIWIMYVYIYIFVCIFLLSTTELFLFFDDDSYCNVDLSLASFVFCMIRKIKLSIYLS